jgi:hypothetical protein
MFICGVNANGKEYDLAAQKSARGRPMARILCPFRNQQKSGGVNNKINTNTNVRVTKGCDANSKVLVLHTQQNHRHTNGTRLLKETTKLKTFNW